MAEAPKFGLDFKNAWTVLKDGEADQVMAMGEKYKLFLDASKTERTCSKEIVRLALENGYKSLDAAIAKGEMIQAGDKFYAVNRDKAVILFVMGEKSVKEGLRILGAHIDSPRIDLKPIPLYEDTDLALFKTHYYGGIKKYQWTSIPLSLYGTVIKADGTKVDIAIGDNDNDPIFFITDLLPHLAKDQVAKTLAEGISGEELNLLVGSRPMENTEEKEKVKANILALLNETYGITEEDFISAEFEVVPAGKARDTGFDRSMITGYGHDDRVCSYAALKAILEIEKPMNTAVAMFMDKEEIGSVGNTGSESLYFENLVAELINLQEGGYNELHLRRCFTATKVLSADVNAAFDPTFASVLDKKNAVRIGYGIGLTKYTGTRGKGGCSDANAEFVGEIRNLFNANDVAWQIGELGKVDQGGGGTIAFILANRGAEVLDCGVGVLSMHGPYEVISKVDLYMAYKGYKAFVG
jgi:aspartyl aminopeptidase